MFHTTHLDILTSKTLKNYDVQSMHQYSDFTKFVDVVFSWNQLLQGVPDQNLQLQMAIT